MRWSITLESPIVIAPLAGAGSGHRLQLGPDPDGRTATLLIRRAPNHLIVSAALHLPRDTCRPRRHRRDARSVVPHPRQHPPGHPGGNAEQPWNRRTRLVRAPNPQPRVLLRTRHSAHSPLERWTAPLARGLGMTRRRRRVVLPERRPLTPGIPLTAVGRRDPEPTRSVGP